MVPAPVLEPTLSAAHAQCAAAPQETGAGALPGLLLEGLLLGFGSGSEMERVFYTRCQASLEFSSFHSCKEREVLGRRSFFNATGQKRGRTCVKGSHTMFVLRCDVSMTAFNTADQVARISCSVASLLGGE